jgi:hypothetical protein
MVRILGADYRTRWASGGTRCVTRSIDRSVANTNCSSQCTVYGAYLQLQLAADSGSLTRLTHIGIPYYLRGRTQTARPPLSYLWSCRVYLLMRAHPTSASALPTRAPSPAVLVASTTRSDATASASCLIVPNRPLPCSSNRPSQRPA